MDRAHRRPRHRSLAIALATLLVPLVVGSAAAAPPGNRPAMTIATTVRNAAIVTVAVEVNRASSDLASCTYVIDTGTAVTCGAPTPVAKKVSTYTIALPDQTDGDHTVTVSIRLRDGGTVSGSAHFLIVLPPAGVFAIAFTNVDGDPGFDPGDILIAKLTDSNGNDAIDAGDSVTLGSFPTDFAASAFTTAGVASHTVTNVVSLSAETGRVIVSSAAGQLIWARSPDPALPTEFYTEGPSPLSSGDDRTLVEDRNCGNRLELTPTSPSQPGASVFIDSTVPRPCPADEPFIDVLLDLD